MTTGPLAGQMATYAYDARNRLISAGNLSYQYDAENSRISVTDSVYNTQTSYVINNNAPLSQVLVQTDGQNNQTFYVYGLGLIGQEHNDTYTTYHFDLRGSTVALTDEGGNVTDRLQYAPFGELAYRSGNTSTPFLFSGRHGVMSDASDLYYMRARYYNPVAKRFLSPDTLTGQITNPQSQNLYIFCKGNPVIYIDPTGQLRNPWEYNNPTTFYNDYFIDELTQLGNYAQDKAIEAGNAAYEVGLAFYNEPFVQACIDYPITTGLVTKPILIIKGFRAGNLLKAGSKTHNGWVLTEHAAENAVRRGFTAADIDNVIANYSQKFYSYSEEIFIKKVGNWYQVVIKDKNSNKIISVIGGKTHSMQTIKDVEKFLKNSGRTITNVPLE